MNRTKKNYLFTVNRPSAIIFLENSLNNRYLCRQFLRISPNTLMELNEMIEFNERLAFISKKEVISIGLNFLGQSPTVRDQCAIFGLSNTIILKARKIFVSSVIYSLSYQFNTSNWIQWDILNYQPEYNGFKGVFGALDGTHIPIRVPVYEADKYRNRKGWISTNVLLLCDFKMRILFCCPGVEGSAHDAFVLAISRLEKILDTLPERNFILADAGYGISTRILTPFCSTRYHLQEFSLTNGPSNYKELFNLRHSKYRNVIERTIGLLKRRWAILRKCNETMDKNYINQYIMACCLLNNFLLSLNDVELDETIVLNESNELMNGIIENSSSQDNNAAKEWRNQLSLQMWEEYIG